MERIQYQHADAKMQMRGWMNAVYGNAARGYVPSHVRKNAMPRRSKMRGCQRMPKCASEVCQYSYGPLALGAPKMQGTCPRLLHVDEEVALEDVLPFLVLLRLFVRFVLLTQT